MVTLELTPVTEKLLTAYLNDRLGQLAKILSEVEEEIKRIQKIQSALKKFNP
jgi:hypothetical protein